MTRSDCGQMLGNVTNGEELQRGLNRNGVLRTRVDIVTKSGGRKDKGKTKNESSPGWIKVNDGGSLTQRSVMMVLM